jgi:hypothetical protein
MEYFARGIVFKHWILTVISGSITYALMHGREAGGNLYFTFTVLEKMRPFGVCLLLALVFSFIGGMVALFVNQLLNWFIFPIENKKNRLLFLLLSPIISTVIYCAFLPLIAPLMGYRNAMPYLPYAWQTAKFLLPWTLSALVIAAVSNYRAQKIDEIID